ncbi:MAG: alkyl sulfatase dimerization domain-containing protein [Ilumatobacteraceae bacterium]
MARAIRGDDAAVAEGPAGQVVDSSLLAHTDRLRRQLYPLGDHAWTLVGNGLSNQTFVRGPGGIIAIDTGESVEEMRAALAALREVASEPVVAVLYTHFHYVSGTTAVTDTEPVELIFGHERIALNRARSGTEIAPTYSRGLVEQFAVALEPTGPDGLVNVGLGLSYRFDEHAPHTIGHVPATVTATAETSLEVAGLRVEVRPAPSDADDSVTFWFPDLGLAVHNLVWPALFNVFAIRGESYRDPRVLIDGLDHLAGLGAEHLAATHGPPMSGAAEIAERVTRYRDAIQFLWDQTVRWTNRGLSGPDLADRIELPEVFSDDWLLQQHYGVAEHHVQQIRSGLFGFFDGDPQRLLPHPERERAERFVAAMGGLDAVRAIIDGATEDDPRWALELAGLVVHHGDADEGDRARLAAVLRVVARRTTSANLRNWCLTRARDADGTRSLDRNRVHRFRHRQVADWSVADLVGVLRVLVVPERAAGVDTHLRVVLSGEAAGLHVRNHVACPTDGVSATVTVACERSVWVDLLCGVCGLDDVLADGRMTVDGDVDAVRSALGVVDLDGFALEGS